MSTFGITLYGEKNILNIENFNHERYFLNNGMEIILIQSNNMNRIFHSISYKTNDKNDFSHNEILRRMMLRSLKNHPQNYYIKTLTSLGIEFNSFTNLDYITYYSIINDQNDLATVMQLEIDRMNNLELLENELELEKQMLLQKIDININADIMKKIEQKALSFLFTNDNFLLQPNTINQIEINNIRKIYQQNYQPCNTKLLIIGNFNTQNIKTMIKNLYDSDNEDEECIKATKYNKESIEKYHVVVTKRKTNINQNIILRFYNVNNDFNYFAWQLFNLILEKNINKKNAYSTKFSHNNISNILNMNFFKIQIDLNDLSINLDEFSKEFSNIFDLDIGNIITSNDIDTAKNYLRTKYLYLLSNFTSFALLMNFFANNEINIVNFNDIIHNIDKISTENINEIFSYIKNKEFIEIHMHHD